MSKADHKAAINHSHALLENTCSVVGGNLNNLAAAYLELQELVVTLLNSFRYGSLEEQMAAEDALREVIDQGE